jgi:hypothetical protein
MSVTLSPDCRADAAKRNGSIARVGSVGPHEPDITQFMITAPAEENQGNGN